MVEVVRDELPGRGDRSGSGGSGGGSAPAGAGARGRGARGGRRAWSGRGVVGPRAAVLPVAVRRRPGGSPAPRADGMGRAGARCPADGRRARPAVPGAAGRDARDRGAPAHRDAGAGGGPRRGGQDTLARTGPPRLPRADGRRRRRGARRAGPRRGRRVGHVLDVEPAGGLGPARRGRGGVGGVRDRSAAGRARRPARPVRRSRHARRRDGALRGEHAPEPRRALRVRAGHHDHLGDPRRVRATPVRWRLRRRASRHAGCWARACAPPWRRGA